MSRERISRPEQSGDIQEEYRADSLAGRTGVLVSDAPGAATQLRDIRNLKKTSGEVMGSNQSSLSAKKVLGNDDLRTNIGAYLLGKKTGGKTRSRKSKQNKRKNRKNRKTRK